MTKQLNYIADVTVPDDPSKQCYPTLLQEKLLFFQDAQRAFGRTALCMSGGGTFGLIHVGVVKVLWQMKLLPRIVSGSSGGSIVAAVLATRTVDELTMMFHPEYINLVGFFVKLVTKPFAGHL